MHGSSDHQLLSDYVTKASESAFCEIVRRYTNLVYSAALRQSGSSDVATDVSQTVFADLATKARFILKSSSANNTLAGWLYQSARFAALAHKRNEQRRINRERQSMEQLDSNHDSEFQWDQIAPLLDEAMADLGHVDREALLLRFFKEKDFRSVGQALGLSDDAAQKRVTRALEKLRLLLTRRSITTSAAALSTLLSAKAVSVAPVELANTISGIVLKAVPAVLTAPGLVNSLFSTIIQNKILVAAMAVALSVAIHEYRAKTDLAIEFRKNQEYLTSLSDQLKDSNIALKSEQVKLAALLNKNSLQANNSSELAALRAELPRLRADSLELAELKKLDGSDQIESYAASWAANVNLVKSYAEEHPEEKIPELENLPFRFWMQSIEYPWRLKTKLDYEFRMNRVRGEALSRLAEKVLLAAMQYQKNSKGNPPTSFEQLKPFCTSDVMDLLTQNYQFQPAQTIPSTALQNGSVINGDWVISRKLIVNESPHIASDQAKIFSIVPVKKADGQFYYETVWN